MISIVRFKSYSWTLEKYFYWQIEIHYLPDVNNSRICNSNSKNGIFVQTYPSGSQICLKCHRGSWRKLSKKTWKTKELETCATLSRPYGIYVPFCESTLCEYVLHNKVRLLSKSLFILLQRNKPKYLLYSHDKKGTYLH